MKSKSFLYLTIILLFVAIVFAEITSVNTQPNGDVTIATVDTKTGTLTDTVTITNIPSEGGYVRTETSYKYPDNPETFSEKCYGCGLWGGGQPTSTPTYYDDGGYTPPYSSPCACSSGQVDVSTNTCDGGCGLQVRTCDGCYWSAYTCDLNRKPAGLPTTETNCNDNIDNDCDNQADYDGGTIKNKGDSDCLVSLSPLTVSANNPNENDNTEEVTCRANAGNLKSIKASIDGVNCASSSSSGNNYKFRCNIGTVSESKPNKEVKCYVDTTLSYLSGSESKTNIDICKLLSASWSNPNARQYGDVKLNVLTTQGCNGKEVKFFVKNLGTGRNASFAPRKANIVNGKAEGSWTVEFESLGGQNPLYYFTAIID